MTRENKLDKFQSNPKNKVVTDNSINNTDKTAKFSA